MAKLNDYLTVGQAAKLLGVSQDTLRRWDRAGKLPAHRHPITGYRLYLSRDLQNLLGAVRQSRHTSGGRKRQRPKRKPG